MPRVFSRLNAQRLMRAGLLALALGACLLFATNLWVIQRGSKRFGLANLPVNQTGLVLGTSPRTGTRRNPFFEGRMDAAALLYKEGKVRHLLLSGDNRRKDYDEPAAMRRALMARGVPDAAMVLDSAGIRTLDSIARARVVFGLEKATIITDDFHLARALFLARANGLDAAGFASKPVPWRRSFKTRAREWGSRLKACLDVYLLGTKPRFYGAPIQIGQATAHNPRQRHL